jgi:lipoprotein NlpI/transglutaminase-like putative cysteine protease
MSFPSPASRRLNTLALACRIGIVVGVLSGLALPQLAQARPKSAQAAKAGKSGHAGKSRAHEPAAPVPRLPTVSAFHFDIAAAPDWLTPLPDNAPSAVDKAPLHYRLMDTQIRLGAQGSSHYEHLTRVVNEAAGLSQASQIEVMFDPSYQKLTIHHVDVIRNGQRLNRLDRKKVQLLQRETQLERRMYDGRVTASLVLDDVRAGDQIDYAYTIDGDNPVFEGRYSDADWLAAMRGPSALVRYRVIYPAQRTLNVRTGPADAQYSHREFNGPGGARFKELLVQRQKVPMLHFDPSASFASVLPHQIQLSEFADWADVARWGNRQFAPNEGPTPLLDKQLTDIRASSANPADQLLAALKLVQTEVRYFGNEFGVGSHKPTSPEKVLAQRFGDCKDKTLLLVTLARRLGLEANPVLVSTQFRNNLGRLLPSPMAFDHVIAQVKVDGQSYFLDGTRAHQTGNLAARQAINLMQGLSLAADTTALATLPQPFGQVRFEVNDHFTVTRFPDDVALEARITYRGDLAESLRESLSTQSMGDIETNLMQPYQRAFPKIQKVGNLKIEPVDQDDAVTAVMHFTVPDFWRFPEQKSMVAETFQWALVEATRVGREPNRTDDLALAYPGIHRHRVRVDYPEDVNQPADNRFDDKDPRLTLHRVLHVTPRSLQLDSDVVLGQAEIPVGQLTAYQNQFTKLIPYFGLTMSVPAVSPARFDKLRTELTQLEEAVQRKRVDASTSTQVQAMVRIKVLDAQIDEGRLPPRLLAQALVSRGTQHDHLGHMAEGARDFTQAMKLDPDNAEAPASLARNAVLSGRSSEARQLANQALARNDSDNDVRFTRAMAALQVRDFSSARQDLERMLQDPAQVRLGYPLVWLSMLPDQASNAIKLKDIGPEELSTDWPRPLVDWALGRRTDDALLQAARDSKTPAEQLCETYFYLGERALANGDTRQALSYYRKAVDQHVVEFIEHAWAVQRIKSLDR